MTPDADDQKEWQSTGATLSDKTARKEFGLTEAEIVDAIRAGKLQYREGSMYGNPWLRLLRREVEALVKAKHGGGFLKEQQAKTELRSVNGNLRKLRREVDELEKRRAELRGQLAGVESPRRRNGMRDGVA